MTIGAAPDPPLVQRRTAAAVGSLGSRLEPLEHGTGQGDRNVRPQGEGHFVKETALDERLGRHHLPGGGGGETETRLLS